VVESLNKKAAYIRDNLKNDYSAIVEGFQIGSVSTNIIIQYATHNTVQNHATTIQNALLGGSIMLGDRSSGGRNRCSLAQQNSGRPSEELPVLSGQAQMARTTSLCQCFDLLSSASN
jgi:hypothetical protein